MSAAQLGRWVFPDARLGLASQVKWHWRSNFVVLGFDLKGFVELLQ
jgi:hypothetical protein